MHGRGVGGWFVVWGCGCGDRVVGGSGINFEIDHIGLNGGGAWLVGVGTQDGFGQAFLDVLLDVHGDALAEGFFALDF